MAWWVQALVVIAAAIVVALGTFRLLALRMLAIQDRARILRLIRAVEELTDVAIANGLSSMRIEEGNAAVADDLRLSHARADAVEGGAGEAADAASRSAEGTP